MNQHTPGPWKAAEESESLGSDPESVTIFSLSDAEYAPARAYGDNTMQMWANARLIAKALEMLTMLRESRVVLLDAAQGPPSSYWDIGGDGYETFMRLSTLLREIEEG